MRGVSTKLTLKTEISFFPSSTYTTVASFYKVQLIQQ